MPSKIEIGDASGWYGDGIHRYNEKTWGMSGKMKEWAHQGEPFQELQKKLPDRVKGKQLAVGNPLEVRRYVNGDTKEGAEMLERLDRVHGCFDRVRYTNEAYVAGKTAYAKDAKQGEYRAKYNGNYAFGTKDWSKRDELFTDVWRERQYSARLESELAASAAALKSSMAKAGMSVVGSPEGGAGATSSPRSPGATMRSFAHQHAYDQIRDVREVKDIYKTTRLGKADHPGMQLGSLSTTNSAAAEDLRGAPLVTPEKAHYNATLEFLRVTCGSPNGLMEGPLLPRQII